MTGRSCSALFRSGENFPAHLDTQLTLFRHGGGLVLIGSKPAFRPAACVESIWVPPDHAEIATKVDLNSETQHSPSTSVRLAPLGYGRSTAVRLRDGRDAVRASGILP